jgi:hypothetical protein
MGTFLCILCVFAFGWLCSRPGKRVVHKRVVVPVAQPPKPAEWLPEGMSSTPQWVPPCVRLVPKECIPMDQVAELDRYCTRSLEELAEEAKLRKHREDKARRALEREHRILDRRAQRLDNRELAILRKERQLARKRRK